MRETKTKWLCGALARCGTVLSLTAAIICCISHGARESFAEAPSVGPQYVDSQYKSPLQLAITADGSRLLTTNRTADTVSVIDIASGRVTGEIKIGASTPGKEEAILTHPIGVESGAGPTAIVASADGKTAYVANRLADTISVIDVATGETRAQIAVANQPFDLVLSSEGKLYVACCGRDEVVQVINTASNEVVGSIAVAQNPRCLALSSDEKTLLVSCDPYDTTRFLNVIDVASGEVRQRVALQMVANLRGVAFVRPNVAVVVHLNPNPYAPLTQVQQGWVNTNCLSFVFLNSNEPLVVGLLLDEITQYYSNPYDIAVTPDGRFAYVSCSGADEILVVDLAKAIKLIESTPEKERGLLRSRLGLSRRFIAAKIAVGANPSGMAISSDGKMVYVANRLDDSVSVISTATNSVTSVMRLSAESGISQLRRGEILFNSASICFQGQFSCASCHPEGHTTGLSWDLEDDGLGNPKNIKSFRGVGGTEPFRWQGEAITIGTEECGPTVTGAMRGEMLSDIDLEALTAYVTSLRPLPNPHARPGETLSIAAERGKAIFLGKAACKRCHTGIALTNGKRRFVETGPGRPDKIVLASGPTIYPTRFDVPHLLGVWDSGPYLHDGRAATLHEIFTEHNANDKHGKTSKLTTEELNDLVEYLKSL